jgi:hypothetical protein
VSGRCHKHRHPSPGAAWAQVRSLIKVGRAHEGELAVFWCWKCRSYHTGHPQHVMRRDNLWKEAA